MIKAAFFDIDGTLLSSEGKVLESTKRAIEKLHQQNVVCCIASGRGPKSIHQLIGELPMDAYILYNGQIVFSRDTGIYENPFEQEVVEKLARFGDEEKRQMIFGGRKRFYGSKSMQFGQKKLLKKLYHLIPKKMVKNDLQKVLNKLAKKPQREDKFMSLPIFDEPIYQCVLLSPEAEHESLVASLPECTITRSNPFSVDIIPKGGSKIEGIKEALKFYDIKLEEAIAFGDSWNDTEMLSEIGLGVAMGNGNDDIKELADFVTKSNDDDGIYHALVHHKIIR